MHAWQPLGKHLMRIEGDLVFIIAQGVVTGPEMVALCEQLLQIQHKYGWAFELLDARGATGMSVEARRTGAEWHRHHNLKAEAVAFGAGSILSTIMALMANAYRLLGNRDLAIHFVATEVEARAWVDAQRQRKRDAVVAAASNNQ